MSRIAALIIVTMFSVWTQTAVAGPAAKPDDRRLSLAMELLTVTDTRANIVRMSDLMEPNMLQLVAQAHSGLDPKVLGALRTAFHEEVQASMGELMQQMAQVYVRHFSAEEMQTVVAFYKTDTGKKVLAEMPAVMKEGAALGQAWGQHVGVLAGERAVARLKRQGYKI